MLGFLMEGHISCFVRGCVIGFMPHQCLRKVSVGGYLVVFSIKRGPLGSIPYFGLKGWVGWGADIYNIK